MGFKNSVPQNVNATDRPINASFAFPQAINIGMTVIGPITDTSTFSSFYSWWGWDAPVGNFLRITLLWLDIHNAVTDKDEFYINGQGAGSPTVAGGAFIRGPVRGDSVQISLSNLGAVNANNNYAFYGSLRNIQNVRAVEDGMTNNVLFGGTILPGANTTTQTYLPLFSGAVAGSIEAVGTAGQTCRVTLQLGVSGAVFFDKNYTPGTTANDFGLNFIFPRVPVNIQVQNLGAQPSIGIRTIWIANEPQ